MNLCPIVIQKPVHNQWKEIIKSCVLVYVFKENLINLEYLEFSIETLTFSKMTQICYFNCVCIKAVNHKESSNAKKQLQEILLFLQAQKEKKSMYLSFSHF